MKGYLARNGYNIAASALAIVAMWVAWIIAYAATGNDYLVPSFGQTAQKFFVLFASGYFWSAFGATLSRTLVAFCISFVLGALCAAAGTLLPVFAHFLRPVVAVFRTLPTMAVLLLILVWASPVSAPVIVTVLVLFPVIYSQLTSAVSGVDAGLLEMAKAYRLTFRQKLTGIYVPHVAPLALAQTGTNLSFGIKLTVSAEVMAHTYVALGGLMSESQLYYDMPQLAALTVCAVLAGLIVEFIFRTAAKYAFPWRRGEEI